MTRAPHDSLRWASTFLQAQAALGDVQAASDAVQALRALGLEDAARQTAIEPLLLERRG